MNKKGFTLVEIIAVIVLLVTIGGIFTVSMVRKLNDKDNNKDTVKQIISAADAYVSANKEEIEKLYEGYNFVDITIKDLKNNGLLNDDIIDPNTNEKYSDDEKVRITLNGSTGAVEFTISPKEKDNTYLVADDIYLKYDANNTNWCDNDNNVFMGLNSSDKNASRLVLVNASKADETYTLVKNDTIVKKECNVNATKAGNYEIKYEYTYNGSTVSKTRNVHVSSNDKDIESFTAIINDNHNKIFLDASKEETNITLTITYRNGTKETKETTIAKLADEGFKISEFDTSTIGTKKSIITYANTNSDGSIPSPFELTYIVSDKLIDFISDSCVKVNNNPDECYYIGEAENNYVRFDGSNTLFRLYHRINSSVKIISNSPFLVNNTTMQTTGVDNDPNGKTAYGLIGKCKSAGCCNGGRYFYTGLGGAQVMSSSKTFTNPTNQSNYYPKMDTVLDKFYYSVTGKDLPYIENQVFNKNTGIYQRFASRYGLLTQTDYNYIAKCSNNSCVRTYLTNNSNQGKSFWLIEAIGYSMTTSNFNHGTPYAAATNNYVNAKTYSVNVDGSIKSFGGDSGISAQTLTVATNFVRPTLSLKNAVIIKGNGTLTNPFVVK